MAAVLDKSIILEILTKNINKCNVTMHLLLHRCVWCSAASIRDSDIDEKNYFVFLLGSVFISIAYKKSQLHNILFIQIR